MSRKIILAALAFASLSFIQALAPARSYACSCAAPPSVKAALQAADAVFVGKVLNVGNTGVGPGWHPIGVLFEVQSVWKGPETTQITIYTGSGGGDCGYSFDIGQRYLIYGYKLSKQPSITVGGRELVSPIEINYGFGTNICSRTMPLSNASVDLKELGTGNLPTDKEWSPGVLFYAGVAASATLLGLGLLAAKRRRNRRLQA